MSVRLLVALAALLSAAAPSRYLAEAGRSFSIANDSFVMDGKTVQIRSGSVHYFRVPRAYWRDRLQRARAMGLNAVQTVIPWNWHEEVEGQLRWDGERDVEAFIRLAQDMGLLVLLRPGPYICAEWEFGGFPAWILPRAQKLRTFDPTFIPLVEKWWGELLPRLKPLLFAQGGPVVMVQLENEFGSFGNVAENPADRHYMEYLLSLARAHLGLHVIIYTTDGGSLNFMRRGSLEGGDVLTLGDGQWNCKAQAALNPPGLNPCMNTESYSGWLSHWGERAANTSAGDYGVARALDQGYSFNIYMAHGGTSFGWMSGANGGGRTYQPDITSYDYGAPIAEDGSHGYGSDGRDKFLTFRAAVQHRVPASELPPEPDPLPRKAYGELQLQSMVPLLCAEALRTLVPQGPVSLPVGKLGEMEATFGQRHGFVMYSGEAAAEGDQLEISEYPRDRAQVFLSGTYQGAIFRPEAAPLKLERRARKGESLQLLVENMGRLNYGSLMRDPKGIPSDATVTLSGTPAATNWSAWSLPLDYSEVSALAFSAVADCSGLAAPAFYRASLQIEDMPVDTFLRLDGFTKGIVWINGVNLGRYWQARPPQRALYVPAPFLRRGGNDVIVLELERAPRNCTVTFDDKQDLSARPMTSPAAHLGAADARLKPRAEVAYI